MTAKAAVPKTLLKDKSEAKNQPLTDDIRLLGRILGEVIREQEGHEAYQLVERIRKLSVAFRLKHDAQAGRSFDKLLKSLSGEQAVMVIRAFSYFSHLANIAEDRHHVRRRDIHERTGGLQPGSLAFALERLHQAGVRPHQIAATLQHGFISPVLTAHPTEVQRKSILDAERAIAALVGARDSLQTERELRENESLLRARTTQLWQTRMLRYSKLSVADEVENALSYYQATFLRQIPKLYAELEEALPGHDLNSFLRMGHWIGGDRDGNPNVTADTLRHALSRQCEVALRHYLTELHELGAELSISARLAQVSPAMQRLAERSPDRNEHRMDEPYRRALTGMYARAAATLLQLTGTEALRHAVAPQDAYASPAELLADLETIEESLRSHHAQALIAPRLKPLLRAVKVFGFHLATLDLRQDSEVHRRVAGRVLGDDAFAARPAAERAALLRAALPAPAPRALPADGETTRTLDVMRTVAVARRRHGPRALGPYIISMAQGADDVLAVLFLAHCAGLRDANGAIDLDVAPLFETVDDLDRATATLGSLLDDDVVRRHLAARGDRQMVMLGYSDSSKISGIAASRWALYRVQEELANRADEAGVALTFFHGRGGSVGRGGGKTREAVLADPCGALRGHLRLTELGEIVHTKYGLRGIAGRTLELMTGAVLETTVLCSPRSRPEPGWTTVMDLVAGAGRADYQRLVHDHPLFDDYFRAATPIDVIERLEIGSRPASRRGGRGVENLRAIPWVFAWTQNRHLLPAWYGVGRGLTEAAAAHDEQTLREMAARWPFFTNLLSDLAMVLAKADLDIAARYAALAGPAGDEVFPIIRARLEETREWVLRLRDEDELLDREPALQRSIRLRNPYVDPISLLQVDLLARWRATDRQDAELEKALFETVRGISQGLQNTG